MIRKSSEGEVDVWGTKAAIATAFGGINATHNRKKHLFYFVLFYFILLLWMHCP